MRRTVRPEVTGARGCLNVHSFGYTTLVLLDLSTVERSTWSQRISFGCSSWRKEKCFFNISENVENAGKLLSDIVFDNDFNNIKYLHLSNKLVFYKKHKLLKSEVSEEASKKELALRLWSFSEELCRSFGFVSFNI